MKQKLTLLLLLGLSLANPKTINAGAPAGESNSPILRVAFNCSPAFSRTNLEINSIRATILGGGDKWPFSSSPNSRSLGFEAPINSGKSMVFAGSLWIAAKNANQVLLVAAQTYRQTQTLGVSFWPGPLGTGNNVGTNMQTCQVYDRIWKVSKSDIEQHKLQFNQATYQAPVDIAEWPGNGRAGTFEAQLLAPFVDLNNNDIYEPELGEYPRIAGDQATWHVYNAMGNISGTGTPAIGLEIQEENFAFSGTSLLNQAAFFRHKIINRSNNIYDSVYTGMFLDPDLGGSNDDFIGCDVGRNLGYSYNSDNNDDGIGGYGLNPPTFGLLQLEGPFSALNDGIDNDRDGQTDEMTVDCDGILQPERIAMTSFRSFDNNATVAGNPSVARHVMQYLSGFWKDGTAMTFGGSGYLGSSGSTNVPYSFAYPGNSDPNGWGYVYAGGTAAAPPFHWTEQQTGSGAAPNVPGDRRFVMSNGKVQMLPGAVQQLLYAGIWGRDSLNTDSAAAFNQLLAVSDYVQQQYNNCFLALPTSVKKLEKSTWTIYPNPVEHGQIYVSGNFDPSLTIQVSLVDLQGRKHQITLTSTEVDRLSFLTQAQSGLYLIEIKQGEQRKVEKIFIR